MKTLCFTGHRPQKLGGYSPLNPLNQRIQNELRIMIKEAINQGYTQFISGGALGVDQWAAEIVLDLKKENPSLNLIIARPFPSQSKIWPKESQEILEKICSQSEVVDVCPDPYAAWKMQKRNEYMIKESSLVIAVYDGSGGGTGNAIAAAKKMNKEIWIINPKSLS